MLEVMSWNTALTENYANVAEVFKYIKNFLDKPNTIAVLQQVPLKDMTNGGGYHIIHQKLMSFFQEDVYTIFHNYGYNNGRIYMETVVITKLINVKMAGAKYYPDYNLTNREFAIKVEGDEGQELSILGIHAKNGEKNAAYLRSLNGNPDIIVGDFNAGDYPESENQEIFRSILQDHVCICNLPTKRVLYNNGKLKRKSCIDHIFVRRKYVTKCSDVKVHENITYSDHYPITFKIDF
jgi:endonuclease/exonuclease/phosphatase family metal-dependent hydrolase